MTPTLETLLAELSAKQDLRTQAIYAKQNAAQQPIGIKMGELRSLAKGIEPNRDLADRLFQTNILEAMILACLIQEPWTLTSADLHEWVKKAKGPMLLNQGLIPLVMNTKFAFELVKRWTPSKQELIRYAGYQLYSAFLREADLDQINPLMGQVFLIFIEKYIFEQTTLVQNAMNNVVVMAGLHVPHMVKDARHAAETIGHVDPLVAKNSCNSQSALDYLNRYQTNPKYSRVARMNQGAQ
jgi:3-methyladenine DNA glycosylase AlkD